MKKDNETKMKEILNELEDELFEERVNNKETEENVEEEAVETETEENVEEETVESEIEENVEEEAVETETEENVEEEAVESEIEENVEEETVETETEENVEEEAGESEIEETVEEEVEEKINKEESKKEKHEETKKVEKKPKEEVEIKESPIRNIGNYLIEKLKKYRYVLILDLVVFLFLFFVVPMVILEVNPAIWMSLFLVFTIIPTLSFYFKDLFKGYQILVGLPFFYLSILCILDRCTIKDLYGITAHGSLDKTPAWVDAILVTFIIVFFQYLGIKIVDLSRKCKKGKKEN